MALGEHLGTCRNLGHQQADWYDSLVRLFALFATEFSPAPQDFPSLCVGKTLQLSYHKLEHATPGTLSLAFAPGGDSRRYRRSPFEVAVSSFFGVHSSIVRAGSHLRSAFQLQLNCLP